MCVFKQYAEFLILCQFVNITSCKSQGCVNNNKWKKPVLTRNYLWLPTFMFIFKILTKSYVYYFYCMFKKKFDSLVYIPFTSHWTCHAMARKLQPFTISSFQLRVHVCVTFKMEKTVYFQKMKVNKKLKSSNNLQQQCALCFISQFPSM